MTEDLHEVTFIWPRTDAASVVLTGTFDNWSKSIRLTKSPIGFTGSIKIPWNQTIAYKYIVDGNWSLDDSKPKRVELGGYVNNVYVAPSKPSPPQETTVPVKAPSETPLVHLNGTMNRIKTEHTGDASAAQDVPEGTEAAAEMHDELRPKINGHLEMSKPLQDPSSVQGADKAGDSSVEKGTKPIPVDRHSANGTMAELEGDKEEGISQAEQKPKEDPLEPVPEPVKESAEAAKLIPPTSLTSPKAEQEVSQVASSNGSATSAVPEERKRSPIMSFVPVNVPLEAPPADGSLLNGTNGVSGEETSTHKPLRPVSKIPQSPTTNSEAAAGPADQSTAKQTTGEAQEGATTEAGPSQGATQESPAEVSQTIAEPEEKVDIPAVRPATAPAPATQVPQSTLTEVPQPDITEPAQPVADEKPSNILSTAPPVATPVKEAEAPADTTKTPVPAAIAPAPVPTETKPAGKSPSAPSSPTKARFPRVSRESSASEPPQNGIARKRKSTFLEKIKHIFSHEKDKGKGKSKK